MSTPQPPAMPYRVVFKSIEQGDLLKLDARSNISQSGGGARDFRFPFRPFQAVMPKLFPTIVQVMRSRNKVRQPIDIRQATLVWIDENGQTQQMQINYEPPTDARPSEGRIPRVHQIPPLAVANLPPPVEGQPFVLFVEEAGQRLGVHYVSHYALLNAKPPWHPLLKNTIVDALVKQQARNKPNDSASGWVDFTTGRTYAHE
jgi:hypothetical protein